MLFPSSIISVLGSLCTLRELLKQTGDPQLEDDPKHIGPQPNIRRLLWTWGHWIALRAWSSASDMIQLKRVAGVAWPDASLGFQTDGAR